MSSWTTEEEARLSSLLAAGCTARAIATSLDRTVKSVERKIEKNGEKERAFVRCLADSVPKESLASEWSDAEKKSRSTPKNKSLKFTL
jgi:IS30 family transposase